MSTSWKIQSIVSDVLAAHDGEISTHYTGCWRNHAGCLAAYIRDVIADDES